MEDKNKLKKIQDGLYAKKFEEEQTNKDVFKKKKYEVKEEWSTTPPETPSRIKTFIMRAKKTLTLKKILVGSLIFFVAVVIFAFYTINSGTNIVSPENIDISITGPVSVNGGEEFSLEVAITNKSEVIIETADLFMKYPEGAYSSSDSQQELLRARESLDSILPNETITKILPLVLFGEENSEKEISATLEFRFEGSSVALEKEEVYTVRLASSPVNLLFYAPEEVSSKQEFEMKIELSSNSNNTIKDLLVNIDYPFGFTPSSVSPPSLIGEGVWDVGDLSSSDKRTVIINGNIDGREGDERMFKVSVGTKSTDNNKKIGTAYSFTSESVVITKPFIELRLLVDGDDKPEYVSKGEKVIRADVLWKSNIPVRITDGELKVKFDSSVLDKFVISVGEGGFYRSIDNTIIWDKRGNADFAVIEPEEEGRVSFTFQTLPLAGSNGSVFQDPKIDIKASTKGKYISEVEVPKDVTTTITKSIKIESDLSLTARAMYNIGPFKNRGFLPPKVEKETTYTIIWTVVNSSNKMSSVVAKTTLPPYIKWLGVVSPTDEDISFNEVGGEVVWSIGDLKAGVGFGTPGREVAFQIGFLPSVSQIGKVPPLTGDIALFGEDTFTGTIVKSVERRLSTQLSTDPYFNASQAQVTY